MTITSVLRIQFEDNGQDFLHWDVHPDTGKVLDCQPFQYSIWCDGRRHVDLTSAEPGKSLRLYDDADLKEAGVVSGILKHRVAAVTSVPADDLHQKNAA